MKETKIVDLSAFEGKKLPPFLRSILRGTVAGDVHELMKLAAWGWLKNGADSFDFVDFEAGGFDVLGIRTRPIRFDHRDPLRQARNRVVIDTKATSANAQSHFSKSSIPHCNIEEKFSAYANLHYILAPKGIVKPDVVHEPWGLLEYTSGTIIETKEAKERAYIGPGPENDLIRCTKRLDDMIETFIESPKLPEILSSKIAPEVFHKEGVASAEIVKRHEELTKAIKIFEYMYGYNPLGKFVNL